jgi:hypothetical protein
MLGREDKHDSQSGERPLSMLAPRDLLNDARESYTAAFAIDNSQTEVWIQIAFLATLVSAQQVPPTADASLVQALQGLRHLVDQQAQWAQRYGGGDRETRALRAAMAFEISLLEQLNAMLAPAPASDPAPTPDPVSGTEATAEAFAAFVNAAEPIATSYRAHALWRQLRRYESVPRFKQIVEVYRSELVIRGVRRYWGPRF